MKILTGNLKGRTINFKPNSHVRPTADKVRKAIFDTLQSIDFSNARFLDLFSGSGAVGLEALSQGALFATFVEQNRAQAVGIEKNLENIGLADKAKVFSEDVFKAIEKLSTKGKSYDIIFLDPPYEKDLGIRALQALVISDILAKDARVILEANKREAAPQVIGGLKLTCEKVYGDTKLFFYTVLKSL